MYARRATGSAIISRGTCVVKTAATTLPIVLLLAVCDAHEFRLGPELHAEAAALPAEPAHLCTSKGDAQIAQKKTVDPHHPGLDSLRHPQRAIDVRRPYISRQAKRRRIGARDRLLFVVKSFDRQHRSEDFLGQRAGLRADVIEQ